MRKKFWNLQAHRIRDQSGNERTERVLTLDGTISSDQWFSDDITPQMFKDDLNAGDGDVTVWINSPGGDCVAAAQIYNALVDYKGWVTVKIDGLAASAASVIAMAGDRVLMSPVSVLMIHNPSCMAIGDRDDLQEAIKMLDAVKESIINSYAAKTGLSRAKLSRLMDENKYMDCNEALKLGFCDGIIERIEPTSPTDALELKAAVAQILLDIEEKKTAAARETAEDAGAENTSDKDVQDKAGGTTEDTAEGTPEEMAPPGRSIAEINSRLDAIKLFI